MLGQPVLVLRETTERPEAIAADTGKVVSLARKLLDDSAAYSSLARAVNPYDDGYTAARMVEALL